MEYINKLPFTEGGFLSLTYTPLVSLSFPALTASESVSMKVHVSSTAHHRREFPSAMDREALQYAALL